MVIAFTMLPRCHYQQLEMVTLIPRLPLSAKSWAIEVSNTRQSEFNMAEDTPSWMDRGVASQVNLRRWPLNSSLQKHKINIKHFVAL